MRGAVSIGSFFTDNLMVWGKGLVEAYQLENSVAIYPRIIIAPKYINIFRNACEPFKCDVICEDFDGIYFINPFYSRSKEKWKSIVQKLSDENIKRINEIKAKDAKILQKLLWLQKFFEEKIDLAEGE